MNIETKPLPPTLRERNRYLLIRLKAEKEISKKELGKTLWKNTLQFLGEKETSDLNLWIIDWDSHENRGIIKVTHEKVDEMRTVIALIKEINGTRVLPQVIQVSGTLKKARENLIE